MHGPGPAANATRSEPTTRVPRATSFTPDFDLRQPSGAILYGSSATFRFVDLFAGLGGFHIALAALGGKGVFAAEWDKGLNLLYKENFDIEPWHDVNDLVDIASQVPDHDVLTAGFPCQP